MNLNLKTRSEQREWNPKDLTIGDEVILYSDSFECELTVEVTHRGNDEYGGNLASNPHLPMIEKGDHVHFKLRHIVDRRPHRT